MDIALEIEGVFDRDAGDEAVRGVLTHVRWNLLAAVHDRDGGDLPATLAIVVVFEKTRLTGFGEGLSQTVRPFDYVRRRRVAFTIGICAISGQFFPERPIVTRSHPSYRHENPRVRRPALRC
jgi:hypothetical protein